MDENDNTELCYCGDSAYRGTQCPTKGHRHYYRCPKREGLFPIEEVLEKP